MNWQSFLEALRGQLFRSEKSSTFTGLLLENVVKPTSYLHEERAFGVATDPFGNTQITVSPYPYENQHVTSSCVPHGVGLGLAIEHQNDTGSYARLAWLFAYRLRSNYDQEGCFFSNIYDIYKKTGAPLYTTLPDVQTELQANSVILTPQMYNEAAIFKGKEYWIIGQNFNDITTLATVAQAGHGVSILIYGSQDEWGRDFPLILDTHQTPATAEIAHCVCILPKSGFVLNGKKYVTVQDSAHFGAKTLRYLSEDWIKARTFAAGYWDTVATLGNGTPPKYVFTKVLRVGSSGPDVVAMQQLFISQGLLPNDCATGYFGGRTLAALHAFQVKHSADILLPLHLDTPTDVFGPATISVANKLCA